jgi:hypothetical protein
VYVKIGPISAVFTPFNPTAAKIATYNMSAGAEKDRKIITRREPRARRSWWWWGRERRWVSEQTRGGTEKSEAVEAEGNRGREDG